MNSQRGQASILIALIFQVLFIFFAMVVNVGLVIHDKINLQNSVDIAAYYGAMKQAEVMTAMAHVNYQIRQSWKLMNWRLWALSDAGRNRYLQSMSSMPGEEPATWVPTPPPPPGGYQGPIVCVQNPFWYEAWVDPATGARRPDTSLQNMCRFSRALAPTLRPPVLTPYQMMFPFLNLYKSAGQAVASRYGTSCEKAGITNMILAARLLASYKTTVQARRRAMQNLQKLLVANGPNDFQDISGSSVAGTVQKTFLDNLTLPNKAAVAEFEFRHSLNQGGQPVPFMVPIDVRLFLKYADLYTTSIPVPGGTGNRCDMDIKDLDQLPKAEMDADARSVFQSGSDFQQVDAMTGLPLITAQAFLLEELTPTAPVRSLVGFEKDPWVVAYVVVKAKTKPKMLFSPLTGSIELTAEAFAMPFGGKIGPWYGSQWQPGTSNSQGDKIDALLPIRIGGDEPMTPQSRFKPPKYSRFPGDTLGPRSELYRASGMMQLRPSPVTYQDLPHFLADDYFNIASDVTDSNVDPVVSRNSGSENYPLRRAEMAALAPDLFDAAYYSIQPNFLKMFERGGPALKKVCSPNGAGDGIGCWDFGSFRREGTPRFRDVTFQVNLNEGVGATIATEAFWILRKPEHVMTSWSQDSRSPDKFPEGVGIGKLEEANGRSGYSVKIVSRRFLSRGDLPLGGGNAAGSIKNNPTAIGLRE